jgi:thymidine kinase
MELQEYLSPEGFIHLICGPMFAGKSSELMKRVRRLMHMKLRILVINYVNDNRYSSDQVITTHD